MIRRDIRGGSNGISYRFITEKNIYREYITEVTRYYKGVPKHLFAFKCQFYNCRLNWNFIEYDKNDNRLTKKRNYSFSICMSEIL
jgi:hypothetical protein